MVIGAAGGVGRDVINYLSTTPGVAKIVAADVNEEAGRKVADDAARSASYLGYFTNVEFRKCDLFDIPGTTELLREVKPVVVLQATTLGSWWTSHLLPEALVKKASPLGMWLPNHLALPVKLMKAVKQSGIDTKVVNCSFPDAVNVILGKLGMAPVCGGGNFDLICGIIHHRVSQSLGVPTRDVKVFGVGDHSHYTSAMAKPWWIKILAGDRDVTSRFDARELIKGSNFYTGPVHFDAPPKEQTYTSAAYTKNVLSIYFDDGRIHSCIPGPNGLPGGYPTRLNAKGAEVVMPEGITLEEAKKINEVSRRNDGIETIRDDGTVIYIRKVAEDFKDVLGYECYELKINELDERARELNSLMKKALSKYK